MGAAQSLKKREPAVPGATPARDIVQRRHVRKMYRMEKDVLGSGAFATVRYVRWERGGKKEEGEGPTKDDFFFALFFKFP